MKMNVKQRKVQCTLLFSTWCIEKKLLHHHKKRGSPYEKNQPFRVTWQEYLNVDYVDAVNFLVACISRAFVFEYGRVVAARARAGKKLWVTGAGAGLSRCFFVHESARHSRAAPAQVIMRLPLASGMAMKNKA
ncbi:uncharacterized protein LOC114349915 [Ostrinia furnacalis]|uniref:uncharacterized protein LOC114349915 n=1 Tax=Ostrinia furnacalis TaxID=93504 RepID=UPI00103DAB46|nr:uncharacterized protein LOC114349915 [Ostrinia furnacalis]